MVNFLNFNNLKIFVGKFNFPKMTFQTMVVLTTFLFSHLKLAKHGFKMEENMTVLPLPKLF